MFKLSVVSFCICVYTGRHEALLRLHSSSLWTQMDRVKLAMMTVIFICSVDVFNNSFSCMV